MHRDIGRALSWLEHDGQRRRSAQHLDHAQQFAACHLTFIEQTGAVHKRHRVGHTHECIRALQFGDKHTGVGFVILPAAGEAVE